MKALNKPSLPPESVFDDCVLGLGDPRVSARFKSARALILTNFSHYNKQAQLNTLYTLPASTWGKGDQIVLSNISKQEFMDLYTEQMVGQKPFPIGRKHYELLRSSIELSMCPYCDMAIIETLDHFLAKSMYPAFSVLTYNLIPSCFSCNKKKTAFKANNANEQTLHPYYEDNQIETDPWLFADFVDADPPFITFYVKPPTGWLLDVVERTKNHFTQFELAERFGIAALTDVAAVADDFLDIDTFAERTTHLIKLSQKERKRRPNSRKAAVYEALANSKTFIQISYSAFIIRPKIFTRFKLLK